MKKASRSETLDDDSGRLWALYNLASIAAEEETTDAAAAHASEALEISVKLQSSDALHGLFAILAFLSTQRGDRPRAVQLYSASEALRRRIGTGLSPQNAADLAEKITEARTGLSESLYAAAWSAGEAMTTDEAIAYARES